MIGKITTGKSFGGCLLYCLNDKKQQPGKEPVMEGRAELILFNQCFGNGKELIAQFNAVRQLNPNLSRPVLHITLSLAPGEKLSKDKLMEMCEQCATEMGFENNQYIAVHHLDTKHQHLHIVANRIGFDKRTVSDSNNYKKIAAYCRKMEQRYHLQQVLSPRQFLSKEQRVIPRHDQRKAHIREHIRESLAASRSYEEFERLMKEKKYEVIKGRGIAFRDEKKVYVKGSELGYSLQKIQRILAEQNTVVLNQRGDVQDRKQSTPSNYQNQTNEELSSLPGSFSCSDSLAKDMAKAIDHLLQPEESNEGIPYPFTRKNRKKKKGQRPN